MTITEMQEIPIGSRVKCQIDDDPTLEEGMIVNKSKTSCQVFGKDPDLPVRRQGFLAWLSATQIVSVIESPGGYMSVTVTGKDLEVADDV